MTDSATGAMHTKQRSVDRALAAQLRQITRDAQDTYHLGAVIVRVTKNGKNVYTAAMGESMTGVPATTDNASRKIFTALATAVAPDEEPPTL